MLARLGRLPLTGVDPVLERSGLQARAGDRYRSYSLGMKQRLGIAAAMLAGPELLVLDEPTNGLDPAGIVEMRGLIKSFADDGITVLVSSHLISEIEQICDYVMMIRAGRLVHQGSVAELRATQQAEFLVTPEHDADRDLLAKLLQQAGCTVTPGNAEGFAARRGAGHRGGRAEPVRRAERDNPPPAHRAHPQPRAGVLRADRHEIGRRT